MPGQPAATVPLPRRPLAARLREIAARGGGMVPSLIDQGLVSLQSLLISVVLIKLTGPALFGQFVYIFTLVMIAASLQNGLVGIPALVHVASCAGDARRSALSTLLAIDRRYRLAAALVTGLASLAVTTDPVLVAAACCFCFGHLSRETARNVLFATGAGRRAPLIGILAFAVFLPLFAAFVWAGFPLMAPFAASAIGIAVALALVEATEVRANESALPLPALVRAYRDTFPGLAWRLVQSGSNEVQTRSHVFVVTLVRGVDQAGLLEAGRILWAPLVVLYQTWQKVAQPRLASLVSSGDTGGAIRLVFLSIAALACIAALYAAILFALWEPLSRAIFSSFADVLPFALGWLAYTLALLSNWMLIALLNAQLRFRTIAIAGMLCATATITLLLTLAALPVPLVGAVGIMAAVQTVLFVAIAVIALRSRRPGDRA
jgi:hypothetical protein